MPAETIARAGALSDAPDEGKYQAFCQALSASERGRAFLAEYARRNRNAATEQLRAAIEQLQSVMALQGTPQTTEPVKQQLRELLDEIITAQCELEARLLATKAAKLAELVVLVESRISQILESFRTDPAPTVETPAPSPDSSAEPIEDAGRSHLAVVPVPEQPELPIPSPSVSQPPAIALVRSETVIAEVAFVETPPAQTGASTDHPTSAEEQQVDDRSPPAGALSSIMSLSEDERLALFT